MTDPKLVEGAREITSKHLQRPDWIDIGYKDCFVCGTPLDKDEFNKRSASLVGEIAQALQAHGEEVRRKTVEECAKVASEYHYGKLGIVGVQEASEEIATAIRNRMKEKP